MVSQILYPRTWAIEIQSLILLLISNSG